MNSVELVTVIPSGLHHYQLLFPLPLLFRIVFISHPELGKLTVYRHSLQLYKQCASERTFQLSSLPTVLFPSPLCSLLCLVVNAMNKEEYFTASWFLKECIICSTYFTNAWWQIHYGLVKTYFICQVWFTVWAWATLTKLWYDIWIK